MHSTGVRILEALPLTRAGIATALGIGKTTVHKWITRLEGMGLLHVGGWERTVGDIGSVYHLGTGKTPRRPKRYSPAKIMQRYRDNMREAGLYEDVLADQRKYRARRKPPVRDYKTDHLMSWVPQRNQKGELHVHEMDRKTTSSPACG